MTDSYVHLCFDEACQSQLPCVEMLVNMGWEFLPLADLETARNNNPAKSILKSVCEQSLDKINRFEYLDNSYHFSPKNIANAVFDLENFPMKGLMTTSAEVYADLIAGRDLKEFVQNKESSFNFQFFDFENIDNNRFQVAVEVPLHGKENIRPDIVLYVNGIPVVVIENKKSAVSVQEAVVQLIDYQTKFPRFFLFPQLLIATNKSEFLYGTTGTPKKFYSVWQTEDFDEDACLDVMTKKIDDSVYQKILTDLNGATFNHRQNTDKRLISEQDRGVFSLLHPLKLMRLIKNFILYDADKKKIARHQQIRAISKTMDSIRSFDGKTRKGGLIWHTQGSGKTLTMVMLARAIFSDKTIKDPRVIVVTDRKDLDRHIRDTFKQCKLKQGVMQAKSSLDLIKKLEDIEKVEKLDNPKGRVITTLVHKFDAAFKKRSTFKDEDPNIFIFIDEAHRTQTGHANANMGKILPNACVIAFTGTPLMKGEHASYVKFGGYIDKYTIDEALQDKNILPLMYEQRQVRFEQYEGLVKKKIDDDEDFKKLSNENKKKLQQEIKVRVLFELDDVVSDIGKDIEKHFMKNAFLTDGTPNGFKAQLVTPSKASAVKFQRFFENQTNIETAVVISNEVGKKEQEIEDKKEVREFLKEKTEKFGTLDKYEEQCIASFDREDGIQILIVVDKLLTGFDVPRNTFMYLLRPLQDHNLLQAIARVNRLCDETKEQKTAGFIIDYSKNQEHITDAMKLFSKYNPEDVAGALDDLNKKIEELNECYQDVCCFFEHIKNSGDEEEYLRALANEEDRKEFYKTLNRFVSVFSEASLFRDFETTFGNEKLALFKKQSLNFLNIKKAAVCRYADQVDLTAYRQKIYRVLQSAVSVEEIKEVTKSVDIMNLNGMRKDLEKFSPKSAAEAMTANMTRKTSVLMETDPEFYKSFYEKIQDLIEKLNRADSDYEDLFSQAQTLQEELVKHENEKSSTDQTADLFYRNLSPLFEKVKNKNLSEEIEKLTDFFKKNLIVEWSVNDETQRMLKIKIDDYLYDTYGAGLNDKSWDIANALMDLALHNKELFNVR